MSVIPWPLNPSSRAQLAAARASAPDDVAGLAAALIQSRQTILPKRLGGPGPSAAELAQILQAAAHAPDHGQLLPWRFILVPQAARPPLADVFAQALLERDPAATAEQAEQALRLSMRAAFLSRLVSAGVICATAGRATAPERASRANSFFIVKSFLGLGRPEWPWPSGWAGRLCSARAGTQRL